MIAAAFAPQLAFGFYLLAKPLLVGTAVSVGDVVSPFMVESYWRYFTLPMLAIGIATFFIRIRAAQDYYGGVALVGLALLALWAASDLPGMRGFSFGPGTAPRLAAGILGALGAAIAIMGVITEGARLQHVSFRGPFFVTAALLIFAGAIKPVGLVVTSFVCFMVSALGSRETRWGETTAVGVLLTAFCVGLFQYGLKLSFELWPWFMR
ncbi:tripartite tricarboxylate transporter TctB family protein [Afipia sp. TerB]